MNGFRELGATEMRQVEGGWPKWVKRTVRWAGGAAKTAWNAVTAPWGGFPWPIITPPPRPPFKY